MLHSKEYLKLMRQVHKKSHTFGNADTELELVQKIIESNQVQSFLDYGCGKGALIKSLSKIYPELKIQGYDPGVKKYSKLPEPADFVSSTDVLEHIEMDCIDNVLKHLGELILKIGYLEIACLPAGRILPDGRNAHLIQEGPTWWWDKLIQVWNEKQIKGFDIYYTEDNRPERIVVTIQIKN